MTVKTVVSSFLGFLEHYASEATAVSGGFNALIDALPLSAQDKENIRVTLQPVLDAPAAIADALAKYEETPPVVHISASDIKSAVASFVGDALPGIVAEYLATHPVVPDATVLTDAVVGAVDAYLVAHPPVAVAAPPSGSEA